MSLRVSNARLLAEDLKCMLPFCAGERPCTPLQRVQGARFSVEDSLLVPASLARKACVWQFVSAAGRRGESPQPFSTLTPPTP